MDSWKEFDQNPVTHSAAHHLVAIANLLAEYGYARVSDVAKRLEITRGSVSITLTRLKQRGLVTQDERRFLGLSEEGEKIARLIKAKKFVMKKLFEDFLGLPEEVAEIDTCKIEHLISSQAARRAARLLRFLESGGPAVSPFLEALEAFEEPRQDEPVLPEDPHDLSEVADVFRYYERVERMERETGSESSENEG